MFTDQVSLGNVLTILSVLCVWTISVLSFSLWLNGKLNNLLREDRFGSFVTTYERRHSQLGTRIYNLEIWAAKQNGPPADKFTRTLEQIDN